MNASAISIRLERGVLGYEVGCRDVSYFALDLTLDFLHALASGRVEDPAQAASEVLRGEHLLEGLREHFSQSLQDHLDGPCYNQCPDCGRVYS